MRRAFIEFDFETPVNVNSLISPGSETLCLRDEATSRWDLKAMYSIENNYLILKEIETKSN